MRRKRTTTKSKRSRLKQTKSRSPVRTVRKLRISDVRLERGLRILSNTKDIKTAARSIHISVERFMRAAKRKFAIRKRNGRWIVVRRLRRTMPLFSDGRQLAVQVSSKSATLIGRYMSAVGQFLRTNDPKFLTEFEGRGVKDAKRKFHRFETDPNTLYRLSSAGGEPFEEIYRIVT